MTIKQTSESKTLSEKKEAEIREEFKDNNLDFGPSKATLALKGKAFHISFLNDAFRYNLVNFRNKINPFTRQLYTEEQAKNESILLKMKAEAQLRGRGII